MDEADRIPIDIGYEIASEVDLGAQQTDPRTTVREDGTTVINILVPQSCEAEPTSEEEIVVCAPLPGDALPPDATPAAPDLMSRIGEALRFRVGPVVLGSIVQSGGALALGARVKF